MDGVPYDLSAVPEGGEATPQGDHPFHRRITRMGGELRVALVWRYGTRRAACRQPATTPITVTDGPVPSPVVPAPEPEEIAE